MSTNCCCFLFMSVKYQTNQHIQLMLECGIVDISITILGHSRFVCYSSDRPISQTCLHCMLSIAINRVEHVCVTVVIRHKCMLLCNHNIVMK